MGGIGEADDFDELGVLIEDVEWGLVVGDGGGGIEGEAQEGEVV